MTMTTKEETALRRQVYARREQPATVDGWDHLYEDKSLTGQGLWRRIPPVGRNSERVVRKRYLAEEDECWEDVAFRVAHHVGTCHSKALTAGIHPLTGGYHFEMEFFKLLRDMEFIPAGRTLRNAGAGKIVPNCVVLGVRDHLTRDEASIFGTLHEAAALQNAGCGIGFSFDEMRPAGWECKSSSTTSSGPVSFLRMYNAAFGTIKQQNRHGANMAVMCVDHPDVLEFASSKPTEKDLRNFNISVAYTDRFLEEAYSGCEKPWECTFEGKPAGSARLVTRDEDGHLISSVESRLSAAQLLEKFASLGWKNGEPGMLFVDEANRHNTLPKSGRLKACNPCGEQWLHENDVCNLGAINLERMARYNEPLHKWEISYEAVRRTAALAVRFLDAVIDLTQVPVRKVSEGMLRTRRIGLGVMGFASLLYLLEVPYNSVEARSIASSVMSCIQDAARGMSQVLALYNKPFPDYKDAVFEASQCEEGAFELPQRNATLTNVAPTGTTAFIPETSNGLEPLFGLVTYSKGVLGEKGVSLESDANWIYVKRLRDALDGDSERVEEILRETAITGRVPESAPQRVREVFVTAQDIPARDHVLMQAAFQKYCCNACSKTINLPEDATVEDVKDVIKLAWKSELKGCTVYRDNSRVFQPVNLGSSNESLKKNETTPTRRCCPDCLSESLIRSEGCVTCHECGNSKCSL